MITGSAVPATLLSQNNPEGTSIEIVIEDCPLICLITLAKNPVTGLLSPLPNNASIKISPSGSKTGRVLSFVRKVHFEDGISIYRSKFILQLMEKSSCEPKM